MITVPMQVIAEFAAVDMAVSAEVGIIPMTVDTIIGKERDPYTGDYTVTPSAETQTLLTAEKICERNIIINPIPSNYGLITWNGSFITVS